MRGLEVEYRYHIGWHEKCVDEGNKGTWPDCSPTTVEEGW